MFGFTLAMTHSIFDPVPVPVNEAEHDQAVAVSGVVMQMAEAAWYHAAFASMDPFPLCVQDLDVTALCCRYVTSIEAVSSPVASVQHPPRLQPW